MITLRDFLSLLKNDIKCTIVNDRYTEMSKTMLQEEYIGLDNPVQEYQIGNNEIYVWI